MTEAELQSLFKSYAKKVDTYIEDYFIELRHDCALGTERLQKSIAYTLKNGGKRFRPVLSLLTAESLGLSHSQIMPYAVAVEMIHTYSLIHDDLPCMDDDDVRRDQPSNHIVYGEETALLAGDALLTEAFRIISKNYRNQPAVAIELIHDLSSAAGVSGMVGGQTLDMDAQKSNSSSQNSPESENQIEDVLLIHRLKTGALISAAVTGACRVAELPADQLPGWNQFGESLGLSFQVADDILDYLPEDIEPGSFPALMGIEETKRYLDRITEESTELVAKLCSRPEALQALCRYNQNRLV